MRYAIGNILRCTLVTLVDAIGKRNTVCDKYFIKVHNDSIKYIYKQSR